LLKVGPEAGKFVIKNW